MYYFTYEDLKMYNSFQGISNYCQLGWNDQPRDTAFSLKLRVPKKYWWTYQVKHQQMGNGWIQSTTTLIL
jgi:hypothetical protein